MERMISLSQWGMFSLLPPPAFIIPKGFKLSEYDIAELMKPDGIIMLRRS